MIAVLKMIWRWIMKMINVAVTLEAEEKGLMFTVSLPSGKAAVGAAVACGGLKGTTDIEGKAALGPLADGTYEYTVSMAGHKEKSGTATVA